MNILYLVPYPPSLVRVRPYNLLRGLASLGHHVTLLTVWTGDEERQDVAHLAEICHQVVAVPLPRWRSFWNCLATLPTRDPLQAAFCWQPELAAHLLDLAGNSNGHRPFDVVHVEHLRGARFGLTLKARLPQVPIVWDSVDCISHLFRQAASRSKAVSSRWLTRFELGRTQRFERQMLSVFDRVVVTSPADRDAFLELVNGKPGSPVSVLPNGVDMQYFVPGDEAQREPETLVISGKMSYHANVSMVQFLVHEVMPRVWQARPQVRLWVVGKNPPPELLAHNDHACIQVTGTLPDIRPYLQRASIALAPLTYGAGIQNKVLEAMACATPVITTPQAASALQAIPGKEILLAGDAGEFTKQIFRLLDDSALRSQIGWAGRHYVESHHQWSRIVAQLEGLYHEVTTNSI